MNLDRRSFVKFAVGGVVGLHASPLVWKLMDDTAIWTQNWNWVPVPEDGAVAFANTVNPATGTGVKVRIIKGRMKGQRLIRLEANPDHPSAGSGVVAADASSLQLLYNREIRVPYPMERNKVTGRYRKLSWDEAVQILAKKLGDLAADGKQESVACFAGKATDSTAEVLDRFMTAYGSPNLAFLPDAAQTLAKASAAVLGAEEVGFDLANSDYVLSFGTPLLEGFGAPVTTRAAYVKWMAEGNVTLVQVEPRCSVTASKANTWMACNPGTEGLVALAMCNVLLGKGLAASVSGADALKDAKYSPEAVAKISGLDAGDIEKIAVAFAKSGKGVAVCGPGPEGGPGRLQDFMAVLALNALAGKLGKPGGVVARKPLPLKPLGPSVEAVRKPALAEGIFNPAVMAEAALTGKPYKPSLLILAGGNPVYNGPQASVMAKLARNTDYVVAITPYMDESADAADLILPAAHFLECWGDSFTPYGNATAAYGLHRPLITANPGAKSLGDIVLALAEAMGGAVADALPVASMEEALQARTAGIGDFEKLAEASFWAQAEPAYGGLGSAKVSGLKWASPVELEKHHGLIMAGIPSLRTTWGGEPITPYMMKILYDTTLADINWLVVEINPETARHMHLMEGDAIELDTNQGSVNAKVHLFGGVHPKMVCVPIGLGHTAFGMYLKGKGDNFNGAVEVTTDPESGLPNWELTRVAVRKVGGSHV